MNPLRRLLPALAAAALFAACATSKTAEKSSSSASAPAVGAAPATSSSTVTAPPTEVTEAGLRTGSGAASFETRDDLKTIVFDYDSAKLSDEALATLKSNAEALKNYPDIDVLVAGNCDERGTVAYNLALGQKRAKQVRDYYVQLGVDGKRVATISYGKEQPLCSDSTEECWARNRRAETKARAKAGAAAPGALTPNVPPASPSAQ
jgi:peptidoglycan-associated lipoprotein